MPKRTVLGAGQSCQPYLEILDELYIREQDARCVDGLDQGIEEADYGGFEGCGALALGDDRIVGDILLALT